MIKSRIGYRLVRIMEDGTLASAITAQTRRIDDLFVLRYAPGLDTVPVIGLCFVFGSYKSAYAFGKNLLKEGHTQLWRCEYDPSPIKPAGLANWDDDDEMRRFWTAVSENRSHHYGTTIPVGTRFASRVRLLKLLAPLPEATHA